MRPIRRAASQVAEGDRVMYVRTGAKVEHPEVIGISKHEDGHLTITGRVNGSTPPFLLFENYPPGSPVWLIPK